MSDPSKTYRVYSYDSVHQLVTAELVEAETDEDAIRGAQAAGFGTRCEVWEGNRLVAELGVEAA
jgi:hypothetical protein